MGLISGGPERTGQLGYEGELYAIAPCSLREALPNWGLPGHLDQLAVEVREVLLASYHCTVTVITAFMDRVVAGLT